MALSYCLIDSLYLKLKKENSSACEKHHPSKCRIGTNIMVHSFNVIDNKNGNTTVQFYQDNKLRQIIFTKNTEAQGDFHRFFPDTTDAKYIIGQLKKDYLFKANANNPSIFRPIAKSLILKNS